MLYTCFNRCGAEFDSLDEMVAVPGRGDRSPRHFCKSCAERIRPGVPLVTDGGESLGDEDEKEAHRTGTINRWGTPDADWAAEYDWTRHQGYEAYPCPGAWVLGMVDIDGMEWYFYPNIGEGCGSHHDILDTYDEQTYNKKRECSATFIDEFVNFDARDLGAESHKYIFLINGTEVFARIDPARPEWFGAIAAALARFETGVPIDEWRADVEPTTGVSPGRSEPSKRKVERRKNENKSLEAFNNN